MQRDDEALRAKELVQLSAGTASIETTINLGLWTIKTRAQCDLPFTLNPVVLWRGYTVALAAAIGLTTLEITSSTFMQRSMSQNNAHDGYRIVSSFAGGVLASLVFGPLDLLVTQQHKHNRARYFESAAVTLRQLGVRGLLIGTPASCLTDGTFTAAYFGVYPWFRQHVIKSMPDNMTATAVSAGLTGFFAAVITHPLDMIKTVQQKAADEVKKSFVSCAKELRTKSSGVGFFKAIIPRTIWGMSYTAITGITAEAIETRMKKNTGEK